MKRVPRTRHRTADCCQGAHRRCPGHERLGLAPCGCPCHPLPAPGVGELQVGDTVVVNGRSRTIRDMRHLSGGGKLLIFEAGAVHRLAANARITEENERPEDHRPADGARGGGA